MQLQDYETSSFADSLTAETQVTKESTSPASKELKTRKDS